MLSCTLELLPHLNRLDGIRCRANAAGRCCGVQPLKSGSDLLFVVVTGEQNTNSILELETCQLKTCRDMQRHADAMPNEGLFTKGTR